MELGMKLITFSLFGDNPLYCIGAVENARLAKEIYPDWTARFYVAQDVPSMYLDAIDEYGGDIVHCEKKNSYDGLNWRFKPLNEPDVEFWISRDADSRLSWRERNAVDEWLVSGKTAHLMRDSVNHVYTMMAGMFGINNKLFQERYGMIDLDNENASELIKGYDLDILIDLAILITNNRQDIINNDSAKKIISYLGYPGSSGSKIYDYILTDQIVTPISQQKYLSLIHI